MKHSIYALTAVIGMGLAACSESVTTSQVKGDFKGYAARGVDASWPKLTGENSTVANNLLTKNYYIVLDGSGSMGHDSCSNGQSRLEAAKQAIAAFINNVPADADIGLMVFDNYGVSERVSLGNSSREQVIDQVNKSYAGGGTPLRSALKVGYKALTEKAQQQLGYGEYHMVVVTDGDANPGEDPSRAVRYLLDKSPITLHTIGFCIGGSHALNQQGLTLYKSAQNPQALAEGLNEVLAESPTFSIDAFNEG